MEFNRNRIFRLGTRIKTRYDPVEVYLSFDPEKKGFKLREDPDIEKMKQIRDVMLDSDGTLNQKAIREIVKLTLDMPDKEVRRLLVKGMGDFWTVEKGAKNASIYYPKHETYKFPKEQDKKNDEDDLLETKEVVNNEQAEV